MNNTPEDMRRLEKGIQSCRKLFIALGDETRQHLLLTMLRGECGGSRVVDIADKTNLSRPAVSHHMRILREAGLVKPRREGARVYYDLSPDTGSIGKLIDLLLDIRRVTENAPDRGGDY